MFPIMIRTSETSPYRGLIQRISSLPVFVPIGVAGLVLARRNKANPASTAAETASAGQKAK